MKKMEIYEIVSLWNDKLRDHFVCEINCDNIVHHITLTDWYKTLIICDYHKKKFGYSISIQKEEVECATTKRENIKKILHKFYKI
jgi:hypothetical protein